MAFVIPEGLHPDLYPVAWMVGKWGGKGMGEWPGAEKFEFVQEVTFRHDVMPSQVAHADAVEIPRAADGHYYITLMIDGQPMEFMADTGASGVVLSKADAERLGINLADLVYAGQSQTANGIVRTARVRLADVTLGPFHDESIGAFVNEGDMDGSLLGMEYLGRYAIEITGDQMILRR